MLTRLVFTVCLIAILTNPADCQTNASSFAGTWALTYEGQTMMLLSLRVDGAQIAGTFALPRDFALEMDGRFTDISSEHRESPVRDAVVKGNVLQFTAGGDPTDPDRFLLTLVGPSRASLKPEGMPDFLPAWQFDRVDPTRRLTIASTWPKAIPKTPQIAALQLELERMVDEDQALRTSSPTDGEAMTRLAERHRATVLRVFEEYGWPKSSVVGAGTASNYWLIVQHQALDVQKRLLPAFEAAVLMGEGSSLELAYLQDRVSLREGGKQRFGTQISCLNGSATLAPVDDPAGLDDRRRERHLPPIAEYLKLSEEGCRR